MARFDCLPPRGRLMHWLKSLRITRVIAVLLLLLVSVALITHYYLSNMSTEPVREGSQRRKPLGDAIVDPDLIKGMSMVERHSQCLVIYSIILIHRPDNCVQSLYA